MEPIEAQPRSRSNGLCECLLVALALYGWCRAMRRQAISRNTSMSGSMPTR